MYDYSFKALFDALITANMPSYLQLLLTLAALVIFVCSSLSFVVAVSESPRLPRHDDNCSSKFSKSSSACRRSGLHTERKNDEKVNQLVLHLSRRCKSASAGLVVPS